MIGIQCLNRCWEELNNADTTPLDRSWQEYESKAQQLRATAKAIGFERNAGPPREGPALLPGGLSAACVAAA
jgi:hypothetical protein